MIRDAEGDESCHENLLSLLSILSSSSSMSLSPVPLFVSASERRREEEEEKRRRREGGDETRNMGET